MNWVRRGGALVATIVLVAAPAAQAAPPEPMVATVILSTGAWSASGDAVDSGAICGSGVATELVRQITKSGRTSFTFTVACGSGTFTVEGHGRIDPAEGTSSGRWRLGGGTGEWVSLSGGGTYVGKAEGDVMVERYEGRVGS